MLPKVPFFDGDEPAKYVFSADRSKLAERAKALAALVLTLDQYRLTIEAGGTGKPSPFWTAFFDYRIQRDLAAGLLKDGVAFVP